MTIQEQEINQYNFQTILSLNNQLIRLKKLDDIFEYTSAYLTKDIGIKKIKITIDKKDLYKNYEEDKKLSSKSFFLKLNDNDELKVLLPYSSEAELENITASFKIVKTMFEIISQTIYNKYLEFRLIEMTLKDSLTGLYNRQFVDEYLKSSLPLSQRESKKMAFLKVGIDHFKAVIDEFDYNVGDRVLKELANSLAKTVRTSDIVARIEADEFLVILHNVANEHNAILVANKIIENFKNVKVVVNESTNQTLMKTICTGISIFPDDANKIEEIFRSSDIALYEARNKGRSQCYKYKKDDEAIELF